MADTSAELLVQVTGIVHSMLMDRYLSSVAADGEALAAAAQVDLEAGVAACPGWSVARLVGHTGRIHRWVTEMVRTGASERLDRRDMAEPPDGAEIVPWFREGVENVCATLRDAGPDTPVWTFAGAHTSAFWHRRMAQETSVHRWDGESAVGSPSPIATDLAADGIDELLDTLIPHVRAEASNGAPGRIHLSATDTDRQWDVAIGDSAATVTNTASDLLLFLWGRIAPEQLDTTGDVDLLRRWQADMQL